MPTTASAPLFALDWYHPFTMMIWAKTGYTSSNIFLLAKEENSGNYRGPYLVIDNGTTGSVPSGAGRVALILQATPSTGSATSGNDLWVENLSAVNDGKWHFLVATYDGSGRAGGVSLYVDGAAVTTTVFTNTLNGLTTLNSAPVTIGSRDQGAGPYDGLLAEAAIFGTVLTPAQVQQLATDANTIPRKIMSHLANGGDVANGGDWSTAILLVNPGMHTASYQLNFHNETDGSPLVLPLVNSGPQSSISGTMAPGQLAVIQTDGSGTAVVEGWAELVTSDDIGGSGIFSDHGAAGNPQEAAVPLNSAGGMQLFIPFDQTAETSTFTTGIALVNPGTSRATVTVTFVDDSGRAIPTTISQITLNPGAHKAFVVTQYFPEVSGKRGAIQFKSNVSIYGLGIRYNGTAFTSIDAIAP
jgi:hypothetical protein